MEIGDKLVVKSRSQWRHWLDRHHGARKAIWLVYFKKGAPETGIGYDESVEEALCYGWIDGQMRGMDAQRYAVRFTPRRPGGNWSASNRERVLRLLRDGLMTEAGLAVLPDDLRPKRARDLDRDRPKVR